jgi:hypothetical protein
MDKAKIEERDGKFYVVSKEYECGGHETRDEAEFCASGTSVVEALLSGLLPRLRAQRAEPELAKARVTDVANGIRAAAEKEEAARERRRDEQDAKDYRWLVTEAKARGYGSVMDAIQAAQVVVRGGANGFDGAIIRDGIVVGFGIDAQAETELPPKPTPASAAQWKQIAEDARAIIHRVDSRFTMEMAFGALKVLFQGRDFTKASIADDAAEMYAMNQDKQAKAQ